MQRDARLASIARIGLRVSQSIHSFTRSILQTITDLCFTPDSVDLTAAIYVHIMKPHWNPTAEAQTVDRVHGIGQTCSVGVARYVTPNSIESVWQGEYIRRSLMWSRLTGA